MRKYGFYLVFPSRYEFENVNDFEPPDCLRSSLLARLLDKGFENENVNGSARPAAFSNVIYSPETLAYRWPFVGSTLLLLLKCKMKMLMTSNRQTVSPQSVGSVAR